MTLVTFCGLITKVSKHVIVLLVWSEIFNFVQDRGERILAICQNWSECVRCGAVRGITCDKVSIQIAMRMFRKAKYKMIIPEHDSNCEKSLVFHFSNWKKHWERLMSERERANKSESNFPNFPIFSHSYSHAALSTHTKMLFLWGLKDERTLALSLCKSMRAHACTFYFLLKRGKRKKLKAEEEKSSTTKTLALYSHISVSV